MSLELWNTLGTFGTFVVIAATAIAAIVQLRHARSSNQIAAITELQDASETPQFAAAEQWVSTELVNRLADPEFRYQITHRAARTPENQALIRHVVAVGNYYENLGLLTKRGLVDPELVLDLWSDAANVLWQHLAPYAAVSRERWGPVVWESFEYFVVLSRDWMAAHPSGAYPIGVRRIDLKNEWFEADKQYAASRAPA